MKRRTLTSDEQRMWHHVTRHDSPLHSRAHEEPVDRPPARIQVAPSWVAPSFAPAPEAFALPLLCGAYAGIDRNTAERFRKGEFSLDATLDLHGMSREKAHVALNGFLHVQYDRGSRCLLVITGKGVRKDMQADGSHGIVRGVLREMLPQWLAEPGVKAMVLAFDVAKAKHGGSGAYYILLRRKR